MLQIFRYNEISQNPVFHTFHSSGSKLYDKPRIQRVEYLNHTKHTAKLFRICFCVEIKEKNKYMARSNLKITVKHWI